MTTNDEKLGFQLQHQEDHLLQYTPEIDSYLEADPDYRFDDPLTHKVDIDLLLDAAIGLNQPTLGIPAAAMSGLTSGLMNLTRR